MKNFTYENQGVNTYLVYSVSDDDMLDSMALGMITNNNINGLAHTTCVQVNADKLIKYNVSAKITVSQFFMGAVNRARLLGVFRGVVDALLASEDYMIDPAMILLDLEHIYVDVSNCETLLICLPLLDTESRSIDLLTFFKNIIFSSQFDQTENCDYVAIIMNHLNSTPSFSLVDFKNLLDKLNGNGSYYAASAPQPIQNVNHAPVAMNTPVQKTASPQPVAKIQAQPKQQQSQPQVQPQTAVKAQVQPAVKQAQIIPNQSQVNIPARSDMPQMQIPSNEDFKKATKKRTGKDASKADSGKDNADSTKPMTMMYLLQHYSKENKAIYDAQQAAKKSKNSKASKVEAPKKKADTATAFAIPGQENTFVTPIANQNTPGFNAPPAPVPVNNVPMPQKAPVVIQQPVPVAPEQPAIVNTPIVKQPTMVVPPVVNNTNPAAGSASFGETTVLGGGIGETTVLSGITVAAKPTPHLVRSKNNEKISINKPVFRIGKEKSYVDYFIADNTAISRSHANIVTRDDKYFVMDTNSTNHTFVDGQMISSNSEVEIVHGTKLRLANEDFEFNLY